jgi:hypothetical protein
MPIEPHLRLYAQRSQLIREDESSETFQEGTTDPETKTRYQRITQALKDGYLITQITLCRDHPDRLELDVLSEPQTRLLDSLTDAVTSEVGRALVGLTLLQLTVKSLEPTQSIRLHKSSSNSRDFSWRQGISMRSLDTKFITPALRTADLLKLNKDGIMMTRSLAENYPYSSFYKAQIRGARLEWLKIIEALETGELPALPALHFLLSKLLNNAEAFKMLGILVLREVSRLEEARQLNRSNVLEFMRAHLETSDYAARIMEVQMHTLIQAQQDLDLLEDARLVPLSQMRSANKKHGNIGDIELTVDNEIVESWDAKYGKPYLRDELEELADKLALHRSVIVAGFVTSQPPERMGELQIRMDELHSWSGTRLEILTFENWVARRFDNAPNESHLAASWLRAYAESLAQHRLEIAPIDEPCQRWLETLQTVLISR